MTTKYFLLTKNPSKSTSDNNDNQLVFLNNPLSFILPAVNLDYYAAFGLFENGLIEWAKQLCGSTKNFLDIGAHSGTYSLCLSDFCNQVYSFEPQKMTYYALCGSVALSNKHNITCYNFALGSDEQVGTATLKIHSNDGGGSSLHISDVDPVLREEDIIVKTLDSLDLSNIGLIKMDVENNELYVLKGALNTIEQSGYPKILFESNKENTELFDFLQIELGYRIISITGIKNMFLAEL